MSVLETIDSDITSAMKAGEADKLSVLRLVKNSFNLAAKEKKADLTDEDAVRVLQKEAKLRKDSIASYKEGGRDDLASKEEAELTIIEAYLPEQMSAEEITAIVDEAIGSTGATNMQDMGKVMGAVTAKTAGKADGGEVAKIVKEKLSK